MPKLFHISIVGAGLGGIAAGIALRLKGHTVTILESASQLNEIGAGIQIPPNSTRILRAFGLEEELQKVVGWPENISIRRWETGELLGQTEVNPFMEDSYGHPYWLIHRSDYQKVLYERATEIGVKFLLGCHVENVDEEGPTVILKNGDRLTADLVIGADGIRSKVRASILKDSLLETVEYCTCIRAILPAEVVTSDPVIAHLVKQGKLLNTVFACPGKGIVGKWNEPGDVTELETEFKNWDPIVSRLISRIKTCVKWKLAYLPPLKTWLSTNSKVILIGDAAHGMLPAMAQGAALSIEDGAALAECLARVETSEDLPRIMKMFEDVRKPRCEDISAKATANMGIWFMLDGPAQEKRDHAMRVQRDAKAKKNKESVEGIDKWSDEKLQPAIFGYDAVKEMNEYLDQNL